MPPSDSLITANPVCVDDFLATDPSEQGVSHLSQGDVASVDDPIEWPVFGHPLSARDGDFWESSLAIEGMWCAACAITIEKALTAIDGVEAVSISIAAKRARVTWDSRRTRPSQWLSALALIGYFGRPVSDAANQTQRRIENKRMLWQWLVAGLCMMQVMMYAYPSYVATSQDIGSDAQYLLRWASWLISLPVVLFSSRTFFSRAWYALKNGTIGMDLPVTVGILITFMVSTAGTFDPYGSFGHEVYFDSLTMFVFFLLSGRLLELRLRDRVFFAMDSAFHKMPQSVQRMTEQGELETISAKRVQVGDRLLVSAGESFVADGVVVTGVSHVNESVLTGESQAIGKSPGDRIIAGSINLTAPLSIRVERTGSQTKLGEIMAFMATAQTARPGFAGLANTIAKPFLLVVVTLAVLTALFWWSIDPEKALMAAVAVLIVTCPCALSLATPAALLVSVGRLAKEGILVKQIDALEIFSQIDTVVFDKTGTLTTAAMRIEQVHVREGYSHNTAIAIANALAQHSAHPISRALVGHYQTVSDRDRVVYEVGNIHETIGGGMCATVSGPGLDGAATVRLGSALYCGVAPLVVNAAVVYLADQHGWLATIVLDQTLRSDALDTVRQLQQRGVHVAILSGDGMAATAFVADQLGISDARGALSPMDKLHHIQALQQAGHRVAMVGDGINDALVLAAANVSVSLASAVPLAQNQCDVLLQSGNLMDVIQVQQQSRLTLTVIRQNMAWALAYNALAVPLAVAGYLPAWAAGLGMAMSSLWVIANAARLARLKR